MLYSVVRVLRLISIFICAIVSVSFLIFVVEQTKSGSQHQQETLAGPAQSSQRTSTRHKGALHRDIDEAAATFTSPFAGVVSEASGEWAARGVKLLLALAVYGFGLGYVARVLRMRI